MKRIFKLFSGVALCGFLLYVIFLSMAKDFDYVIHQINLVLSFIGWVAVSVGFGYVLGAGDQRRSEIFGTCFFFGVPFVFFGIIITIKVFILGY